MGSGLDGQRVLVTRPSERAEGLARAVEAEGGQPLRFPTIALEGLAVEPTALAPLAAYRAILFVSPAAVAHGVEGLGLDTVTPPARVGAVGRATAAALVGHGLPAVIEPIGGEDSQALLRAPELARERISGERVLIVRGRGGREALAQGLMALGASVDYAEVYRRRLPRGLDPAMAAACDIVTATSTEGLKNLVALVDRSTCQHLRERPLAVNSHRVAAAAREQGFAHAAVVAAAPGDEALVEAIRACAVAGSDGPSESA
jgi:uroporphyrinogen-III synthase